MQKDKQFSLKKKLFSHCSDYVNRKIKVAQEAINNAQQSANDETKSSVGDKYETGRASMQLEIEKYSSQLIEGNRLKEVLHQIDCEKKYESVQTGSLVKTNHGNFFLSISAGKLRIEGIDYLTISFSSPLGQALFNKEVRDEIDFREKSFKIHEIY